MTGARTDSLPHDVFRAGRGLMRLIRGAPDWAEDFDLSTLGFVRSFFAPVLALPLMLIFAAALCRAENTTALIPTLKQTALSDVADVALYPFMLWLTTRLLKLGEWRGFVALINWGGLVFAVLFAVLSLLTLLGENGLTGLRLVWLVLLEPLQILFVWRAARATLKTDISATILIVILDIGLGFGVDQVSSLVFPA